jgi:hypothetical protein
MGLRPAPAGMRMGTSSEGSKRRCTVAAGLHAGVLLLGVRAGDKKQNAGTQAGCYGNCSGSEDVIYFQSRLLKGSIYFK